ncbi:ATP-binding protein [Nonomuraea sp. SYSU D8015]|uniref:ATP-binding protein n=1 Tax=Nonomuraea sp. SYSU D8015 TaxID=2593644 RepID=UPI0016603411|nr:ATP-binding protein [Nonomuraea sp. SYSU D8015]
MSVAAVPPPAGLRVSWTFTPEPLSVPRARHALRAQLADWDLRHAADSAELLVSELVTNAIAHARGLVHLSVSAAAGLLRCEVEDACARLPCRRRAGGDDEGLRGLHLVVALSSGWGSTRTGRGKAVWFELPATCAVDA